MSSVDRQTVVAELVGLLGNAVTTNASVREHHSKDESWHDGALPDAVCFAASVDDVVTVLTVCNRHRCPVIPFGTGTGLEGGIIANSGGICLDLSRMNRIIEVNADDMDCTVQPGVTRKQLDAHLRDTGLFFPTDPGADASLGGMAATRASGTNTVRYGTMRENVLSLKAVLADGSVVTTGHRARKSAAGYDLTHLFIGSEGTLGVIVELTIRLHGRPAAISAARVCFDTIDSAVTTVIQTIQCGIPIARMELVDAAQMRAINAYSGTRFDEAVTLFMEFHGGELAVKEQAEFVGELCADNGGAGFQWTAFEEERREMWDARHSAAYAAMAVDPDAKAYATDVCVPISRLADCIRLTAEDARDNSDLVSFCLGHVGDGNFHYVFLVDPRDAVQRDQVRALSDRLAKRALDFGGTCTGEHGIGIGKQQYLEREFGSEAIALMRTIKAAVDPNNILNPGKLIPPANGQQPRRAS